jgi:NAD(P)-dependent dehydrogenase (short-subunit alcohol dehydrogenase family)
MKLQGRGIIITGASQGLGKAIAQECIREGAHVLLCARNNDLVLSTCAELIKQAAPEQTVLGGAADVSNPEHVRRLVGAAQNLLPSLDGLVNNAGVYGPKGLTEQVDWDDWKQTIEINLMGTVLLCREVVPIFRRQGRGKIVNLSGGGATSPLPRFSAYAASKAAVVRFTETLAEEVKGVGITVNAIAPGALNTRLLDEVLAAGSDLVGEECYARSVLQKQEGGASLQEAARLCVFLLSDASDGITGRLISAAWDCWDKLTTRAEALSQTDVYTLRRILPVDRMLDW